MSTVSFTGFLLASHSALASFKAQISAIYAESPVGGCSCALLSVLSSASASHSAPDKSPMGSCALSSLFVFLPRSLFYSSYSL